MIRYSAEERLKLREAADIKKARKLAAKRERPPRVPRGPKVTAERAPATDRKFSKKQKLEAYVRQDGRCPLCPPGTPKWPLAHMDMDHRVPLALSGPEDPSNHEMLCLAHHAEKTNGKGGDKSRIAKANRQAKLMQPRRPAKRPIRSRGFQ